jgi:uncharacterized membrane protein YdjX (TVP38/TMEM64 family)
VEASAPEEATTAVRASAALPGQKIRTKRATRRVLILRLALLATILIALTVVAYRFGWFDLRHVTATLERLQNGRNVYYTAGAFFLIYALTTAVGFPALPFTVAGGAIFGHLLGSLLSWTAATVGMMLGYMLAGGIGRETARRWLSKRSVGEALTQSTSFWTLLRLRLIPVIPLSVVNFAAGLARTHFRTYVVASAIGILPATVVYAYFADSLVRGLQGARTHALWDILIASAVLMLMSLIPVLVKRRARTAA